MNTINDESASSTISFYQIVKNKSIMIYHKFMDASTQNKLTFLMGIYFFYLFGSIMFLFLFSYIPYLIKTVSIHWFMFGCLFQYNYNIPFDQLESLTNSSIIYIQDKNEVLYVSFVKKILEKLNILPGSKYYSFFISAESNNDKSNSDNLVNNDNSNNVHLISDESSYELRSRRKND